MACRWRHCTIFHTYKTNPRFLRLRMPATHSVCGGLCGRGFNADCLKVADIGYGLERDNIMRAVYVIAERSSRSHPFNAGRGWLELTVKAHACRQDRL